MSRIARLALYTWLALALMLGTNLYNLLRAMPEYVPAADDPQYQADASTSLDRMGRAVVTLDYLLERAPRDESLLPVAFEATLLLVQSESQRLMAMDKQTEIDDMHREAYQAANVCGQYAYILWTALFTEAPNWREILDHAYGVRAVCVDELVEALELFGLIEPQGSVAGS